MKMNTCPWGIKYITMEEANASQLCFVSLGNVVSNVKTLVCGIKSFDKQKYENVRIYN